MFKLIVLALAVYIVYKLFKNDFLKKRSVEKAAEEAKTAEQVAAGDMVVDPECGTYVAVDDSISVRDGDKVYHFCSYECRDKFLKRLENGTKDRSEINNTH